MSNVNTYLDAPARPAPERPPFLGLGDHLLDVEEIVKADSPTKGPTVWIRFLVVESPTHPVGSKVVQRFELAKQERYPNNRTQVELAKDFTAALIGTENLDIARDTLKTLLSSEEQKVQRGRGIRIRARGYTKNKSSWVNVDWKHVEQTEADVKARREAIEAALAAREGAPVAAMPSNPAPVAASLTGGLPGFRQG